MGGMAYLSLSRDMDVARTPGISEPTLLLTKHEAETQLEAPPAQGHSKGLRPTVPFTRAPD